MTFADDALECTIQNAGSYIKERALPGKALELLDAAAVAVKVRREEKALPQDLREREQRKTQIHREPGEQCDRNA